MSATVLTFIGEVAPLRQVDLTRAVAALGERVAGAGSAPFGLVPTLHFASVVVFPADGERPALLVLESNFDGPLDAYVDALVTAAAADIDAMFRCCADYDNADPMNLVAIGDYLRRHVQRPNAWHVGNFGRVAPRIVREAKLYNEVSAVVDRALLISPALATSEEAAVLIKNTVESLKDTDWVGAPDSEPTEWERIGPSIQLGIAIGIILVVIAAAAVLTRGWALLAIAAYLIALRWHELRDQPQPRVSLSLAQVRDLTAHEDLGIQNHLGEPHHHQARPLPAPDAARRAMGRESPRPHIDSRNTVRHSEHSLRALVDREPWPEPALSQQL